MSKTISKRALFLFPTDAMGGAETVTRMLAAAALSLDLFDEVICFVLCQENRGTLLELENDPRVTLVYTGAKSEKMGLWALLRVLSKHKYDFVFSSHTHTNTAVSLLRRMGVLKSARVVSRESTMIFERKLGWQGPVLRMMYWLYGGQDFIVCQTERMEESLRQNTNNRFGDRVVTIPNPISIEAIKQAKLISSEFAQELDEQGKSLVWCGRLAPVKSPLRAIDTLSELHNRGHKETKLVMIGNGPMEDEIRAYAETKGVSDSLVLTGRLTKPASVMQYCDIGLMTSDTEGFPNVILEMLASGVKSVVTTDCAGGLDIIPAVHISKKKTAKNLADLVEDQLRVVDCNPSVERFLEARTPQNFFQRLL